MAFLDIEKPFDRVPRKNLWNAMDEYEIPSELKRAIISMCRTCQSKVRVGAGEGEWFDTISGVRQGRILSPLLFIMYMDLMIREVATTQEDHNCILAYTQTAASEGELAEIMNVWQTALNKYHLKLNLLNTEVMMMGRSHQTLNIKIGDHTLNQVQSFKCPGSTVNEQSTQEEEIKNRIVKYSQNVGCMYRLLKDRNVPKKAKQIIHQTTIRHILILGSECWTLTKRLEQQIATADMKVIRLIQGIARWDSKRNEDLCKQSNMLLIV